MTRLAFRIAAGAGLLLAAVLTGSATPADPPKEPVDARKDNPDKEPEASDEYRREAEQMMAGIEIEVLVDDTWTKARRIEKPLLYYGDPTRDNDRGSVWGWADTGRPVALIELYQHMQDRTKWVYALCNTSGRKVRGSRSGGPWWVENESASGLKDVPGAPVPAADSPQRQRQLKLLARNFAGHEFWDPNNTRYDLRRLDRPLVTYRDEAHGVLEGAVFILANGTNPEIPVFIEARADPKGESKPVWQFAVGRLAHAELHVEYDGKEVFQAPRGDRVAGQGRPYWLSWFRSGTEPKPGR